MNSRLLPVFVLFTFLILSCNNKNKSSEVASYKYEEATETASRTDIPDWIKEGTICYGLVVQYDKKSEQKLKKGKPVKAIVVEITPNAVKMKALETVSLVKVIGCDQQRIVKGQTWDETEGDIYQTREEAITALKNKNLYINDDRATVD